MSRKPPVNPDVDDIADWAKWGYATGTRLLSAVQHRLAKLAGTGRLDPDEAMFLQEALVDIWDALYMGTVSAVRDPETDDLEDDTTYSDGRQVTIKIRIEPLEESVNRWEHNRFLPGDGGVLHFPRGITSYISPRYPEGRHSTEDCFESVLRRFYEDEG